MRLIDADLLKKNVAKWLQGGDPQETVMVELDDIAVSVIMEIEEQPTVCDWIPCSERLPESGVDVNITTRSSIVGVGSFFEKTNEWVQWYCGGGIVVDVIAWQPLPTPYQTNN